MLGVYAVFEFCWVFVTKLRRKYEICLTLALVGCALVVLGRKYIIFDCIYSNLLKRKVMVVI